MNYLIYCGIVVTFLTSLIPTWEKLKDKGQARRFALPVVEWARIAFAIAGAVAALRLTYLSDLDAKMLRFAQGQTLEKVQVLTKQNENMSTQIQRLDSANAVLLDRAPEFLLVQRVRLDSLWECPIVLRDPVIVTFVGFRCAFAAVYTDSSLSRRILSRFERDYCAGVLDQISRDGSSSERHYTHRVYFQELSPSLFTMQQSSQMTLIPPRNKGLHWALTSYADKSCSGQVIIQTIPRANGTMISSAPLIK